MNLPIKIKKVDEKAKMPEHGSGRAAGYDVFACIDEPVEVRPHETVMISTGLSIAVPDGYWLGAYARSGLASKQNLRPANCVGVIDSDYRGTVFIAIHNDSEKLRIVEPNEKIAQLIVSPFSYWDMKEVEELDETERGIGGFGSTGMK